MLKGDKNEEIIIIGGGVAGISAGIYARKAGFEVEIFEKNHVAGGQYMGGIGNCIILIIVFIGLPEQKKEHRFVMCGR